MPKLLAIGQGAKFKAKKIEGGGGGQFDLPPSRLLELIKINQKMKDGLEKQA